MAEPSSSKADSWSYQEAERNAKRPDTYHSHNVPTHEPSSIVGSYDSASACFFDDMPAVSRSHVGSYSSQWSSAEVPIILDGLTADEDDGGSSMPQSSRASSTFHGDTIQDSINELQSNLSAVRLRSSIAQSGSESSHEVIPTLDNPKAVMNRRIENAMQLPRKRPPPLVLESLKPDTRPANARRGISQRSQENSAAASQGKPHKRERADDDEDEDTFTPADLYVKAAQYFDESYSMESPSQSAVKVMQEEFIAPHVIAERAYRSTFHAHHADTSRRRVSTCASRKALRKRSSDDLPNTPGLGQHLIADESEHRTPMDMATSLTNAAASGASWRRHPERSQKSEGLDCYSPRRPSTSTASNAATMPQSQSSPNVWTERKASSTTIGGLSRSTSLLTRAPCSMPPDLSGSTTTPGGAYMNPLLSGLPRFAQSASPSSYAGSQSAAHGSVRPSKTARVAASHPQAPESYIQPRSVSTNVFVSDSVAKDTARKGRGRGLASLLFHSPKKAGREASQAQEPFASGMRALRRLSRRGSKASQGDIEPINSSMLGISINDEVQRDNSPRATWHSRGPIDAPRYDAHGEATMDYNVESSRSPRPPTAAPSIGVNWAASLEQGICLQVVQGDKMVPWRMKYHSYDPFRRLETAHFSQKRGSLALSSPTLRLPVTNSSSDASKSGVLEFETDSAEPLFGPGAGSTTYQHEAARVFIQHLSRGNAHDGLLDHAIEIDWKHLGKHELFGSDKTGTATWRLVYCLEEGHRSRFVAARDEMIVENVRLMRPLRFSCSTSLVESPSLGGEVHSQLSWDRDTTSTPRTLKGEEGRASSRLESSTKEPSRPSSRLGPISGSFVEPPPRRRPLSARVTSSNRLLDTPSSNKHKRSGRCLTADGVVRHEEGSLVARKGADLPIMERDKSPMPTYQHLRRPTAAEAVKLAYKNEHQDNVGMSYQSAKCIERSEAGSRGDGYATAAHVSSRKATRSAGRPRTSDGPGSSQKQSSPKATLAVGLSAADAMRHLY